MQHDPVYRKNREQLKKQWEQKKKEWLDIDD